MAALTFKCPNCDGGLVFDPQSQKFACEYCMSKFAESELATQNPASDTENSKENSTDSSHEFEENAAAYSCPSCGAEVVTDATTAATYCYYCHNPVVLSSRLDGSFKPDSVIPFIIEHDDAVGKFLQWGQKKWFVPKFFFSKDQIEKVTGVYFPHWVVDSESTAKIDGQGEIVTTWTSGDNRYTKTKTYHVVREAEIHLEDVTRQALSKANRQLVDGVHPFDGTATKPFTMAYLSGFQAEKRDIERSQVEQDVNDEIIKHSKTLIRDTAKEYSGLGGNEVMAEIASTDWSYTLLPVWTLTYKGNDGKIYYYAMNGQTGKTCGKLPIDFKKLALLFGAVSVPLFIILSIVGYLS